MTKEAKELEALAADIDLLASALSAGLSFAESVTLLAVRSSQVWRDCFAFLNKQVARHSSVIALGRLKTEAKNSQIDRLVETLICHLQFGGFAIGAALADQSGQCRELARVLEEAHSRIRAVLMITRLGVLSPFVLLALLSAREENRAAFLSEQGLGVIAVGVMLVAFAYFVISRAARLHLAPRGLAA